MEILIMQGSLLHSVTRVKTKVETTDANQHVEKKAVGSPGPTGAAKCHGVEEVILLGLGEIWCLITSRANQGLRPSPGIMIC